MKTRLSILATLALGASMVAPGYAQDEVGACLITKTDINPFFVKMKEGATAKAEELGIELLSKPVNEAIILNFLG